MDEMIRKKHWHTAQEWADMRLPGIPHTESGFIRYANKNKDDWQSRNRKGKGGGLKYSPRSPSPEMLDVLKQRFHSNAEQINEQQNDLDLDVELYAQAPDYNRKKADQYLWIFQLDPGVKGVQEIEEFLNDLRLKYPGRYIPSRASYYRKKREFQHDGKSALLGQYGKRAGNSKIDPEQQECYNSLYLSPSRPSVNACWLNVIGKFATPETIDSFHRSRTFQRQLEKTIGKSKIYYARFGEKKWKDRYGNFITRDYFQLKVGEVWVSDHFQLDVLVRIGPGKKTVRPWATAWVDMKSWKVLSVYLHADPPNSDHIFMSFYHAALKFGLPKSIYLDNGKDYRCLGLAGGRYKLNLDEKKASSLVALLDIAPIFAVPYNARGKINERIHLEIKNGFSKSFSTYCGGNVIERPETLAQNLKSGDVINLSDFTVLFEDYIFNVYNKMPQDGKILQGQSPDDAFNAGDPVKRVVSRDALKFCCMRTSSVTIGRNGAKDSALGVTYWNDWMAPHKGRRVFMRRDVKDYLESWIFDAHTEEFLGPAHIRGSIPAVVQKEESKQLLKEAMAEQRREIKLNKEFQRDLHVPSIEDRILSRKRAAILLNPDPVPENEQNVISLASTKADRIVQRKKKKDKASGSANNRALKIIGSQDAYLEKLAPSFEAPPYPREDPQADQPEKRSIMDRLLDAVPQR